MKRDERLFFLAALGGTQDLSSLLLSHFSRVWLCATPQTAAHQAPQSLGFSRQERWSGLPFPSPMHESEKWKWSRSVMSDLSTPWTAAYQAPPSVGFSRQEYWSGVPLVPWPGIKPMLPALGLLSLNHLTAREVPEILYIEIQKYIYFLYDSYNLGIYNILCTFKIKFERKFLIMYF